MTTVINTVLPAQNANGLNPMCSQHRNTLQHEVMDVGELAVTTVS